MDKTAYDMACDSIKDKWCPHIICSELRGFWCNLDSRFSGRVPCSYIQRYTCPVEQTARKDINGK